MEQITKVEPNFIGTWRYQAWNLSYNVAAALTTTRATSTSRSFAASASSKRASGTTTASRGCSGTSAGSSPTRSARPTRRSSSAASSRKTTTTTARSPWISATTGSWARRSSATRSGSSRRRACAARGSRPWSSSPTRRCATWLFQRDGRRGRVRREGAAGLEEGGPTLAPVRRPRHRFLRKPRGGAQQPGKARGGVAEAARPARRVVARLAGDDAQGEACPPHARPAQGIRHPAAKRTAKQFTLAAEADERLKVTHKEVAMRWRGPNTPKPWKSPDRSKTSNARSTWCGTTGRSSISTTGGSAPRSSSPIRPCPRKMIYQGDRVFAKGDMLAARAAYEQGLAAWRKVLERVPETRRRHQHDRRLGGHHQAIRPHPQ